MSVKDIINYQLLLPENYIEKDVIIGCFKRDINETLDTINHTEYKKLLYIGKY